MLKVQLISEAIDLQKVFEIRKEVFVKEQNVSPEEEYDQFEDSSRHFLALYGEDQIPCGTARWRFTDKGIKLERFAILLSFRGLGLGAALVQACLNDIAQFPESVGKKIYMHAQVHAVGFYEKLGFQIEGEEFEEAGIRHFTMFKF